MNPPDDPNDLGRLARQYDAAIARDAREKGERRNRVLSCVAIAVSVLAAAFTAWQGYEASQARQDAKEAAKQARDDASGMMRIQTEQGKQTTDIARRSAEAAIESNRLSMQALAVSQGANVTVQDFQLSGDLAPGKNVEVLALLWNRGNVPADVKLVLGLLNPITFPQGPTDRETINVFVGNTLHLREYPDSRGTSGPLIPFKGPLHFVLPPGGLTTHYVSTEPLLDESEVGFVKRGLSKIRVVAFLEYRNGFGKTERRGFCGVYEGRSPRTFDTCTGFSFRFDKTAFEPRPF